MTEVASRPDQLSALQLILDGPRPAGSVVLVCTTEQRAELADEIAARGGHEMSPAEIAARVAAH